MRLNPAFKLHKIGRLYMIVDNDANNADLATVYTLNATAGRLWQLAEGKDFTASQLAEALCEEFDVTPEKAAEDAKRLVDSWVRYGFTLSESVS